MMYLKKPLKNVPVIDCLRGIAASMVCFFHFVHGTKGYIEDETVKNIFFYGTTGVQMFFVISGVVIPLSMIRGGYTINNWGYFMMKRLVRLEPPYLASIALALCYFKIRSASSGIDIFPDIKNIFLHIGYLVPFTNAKWILPPYWTLCVEFHYYIALSLLLPLVLTGNKISRYLFYTIFLTAPFLLPYEYFFPIYAPLFLMGILYTFSINNIIESKEYGLVMLLCLIVSLTTLPVAHTITALLTILIIQYVPNFTNKGLRFLGTISYSLYLLHPITGAAVINILSHRFRAGYQKPIIITAGYIFSVICAYIFYRVIEKGSQKLSSKIKYSKPEPSLNIINNESKMIAK